MVEPLTDAWTHTELAEHHRYVESRSARDHWGASELDLVDGMTRWLNTIDATERRAVGWEEDARKYCADAEFWQKRAEAQQQVVEAAMEVAAWATNVFAPDDLPSDLEDLIDALVTRPIEGEALCDCGNPMMVTPDGQHHIFCASRVAKEPVRNDGCTCPRTTYDEACHELHRHECPVRTGEALG